MYVRPPYDNEQYSLSKDEMILAVAAETKRRKEKGYSFYCFVVSAQDKYLKTKKSELIVVLNSLKIAYVNHTMSDNTRIQLLVQCGAHWTAADLLFNRANGVSAFIIDAAGDDRYLMTLAGIQNTFSTPEVPALNVYLAIRGIQWDMVHCAVFSLHHAFKASKIGDLHTDLEQRQAYFVAGKHNDKPYLAVNVTQLPPSFVTVIQKSHSLEDYLQKNTKLVDYKLTKKGLSLHEVVWGNTEQNGKYITNKYIEKVKAKAKKSAESFYNESPAVARHQLKNHISITITPVRKPEQLPPYHIHQVSGLLTEVSPTDTQVIDENFTSTNTSITTSSLFAAKKSAEATTEPNTIPTISTTPESETEGQKQDKKF